MKKKVCLALAISLLLFVLCGCEEKKHDPGKDSDLLLFAISDRLKTMESDCNYAKKKDADTMREELDYQQNKCNEIRKIIDEFLLFGTANLEDI